MRRYIHFTIIITITGIFFLSGPSKYEIYAAPPSPFITLDPSTGVVGTQVTIVGGDFKKNDLATITYDGIVLDSVYTGKGNTGGAFSITITVPTSSAGAHTIRATDTQGSTATATFTVVPSASMNPTTGAVGSTVTVSGDGAIGSSTVTIKFDGSTVVTTTANSAGSFSAAFTVPASIAGVHTVQASDGTNSGSGTFTVVSAVTISPTTGVVGSSTTVSGTGYAPSSTVTIKFDGNTVTTPVVTTDTSGSFSVSFTVPAAAAGVHTIQAIDASSNTASHTFTFIIIASPTITTDPTTGAVGSTVTVSGTGYTATSTVTIKYDGSTMTTTPGTITTDSAGSFSATFTVPASTSGVHTIQAIDASSKASSETFTVVPSTTMSPIIGESGITVSVSGTGYASLSTITIQFGGNTVTTSPSTIATSSTGSFSGTFVVPYYAEGDYTVQASDGTNHNSGIFTIVTDPLTPNTPTVQSIGGSAFGGPSPSFTTGFSSEEYPLSFDGKDYKLPSYTNSIPTSTFETGKSIKISLLIFSNGGPDSIQHVALYTNVQGLIPEIYQSDTYIIYEKGNVMQVVDPHNFFAHVNINVEPAGNKLKVVFDITFAKPMDKSHIILRTWNAHRNSMDAKILNAFQVIPLSTTNPSSIHNIESTKGISYTSNSIQTNAGNNTNIEKSQTKLDLQYAMIKPEIEKLDREKQFLEESTKITTDKAKVAAFIKASQSKSKIDSKYNQ